MIIHNVSGLRPQWVIRKIEWFNIRERLVIIILRKHHPPPLNASDKVLTINKQLDNEIKNLLLLQEPIISAKKLSVSIYICVEGELVMGLSYLNQSKRWWPQRDANKTRNGFFFIIKFFFFLFLFFLLVEKKVETN